MATGIRAPAVGTGPIGITDKRGKYSLIPLSALEFDAEGKLKSDKWPLSADFKGELEPYLKRLNAAEVIAKGPEPKAKPALCVSAVTPGSTGLVIEITFTNVQPKKASPPSSTADVTVEEKHVYKNIALRKLVETIGNKANGGSRPGLVFVSGPVPSSMPVDGEYALKSEQQNTSAKVDIPKRGGGTAFWLEARSAGDDGKLIKTTISDVDTTTNTFTLTVNWAKSVKDKKISTLADEFAFVVTIKPPEDGYSAPPSDTFTLVGGADAVSAPAVKSSATIPSAP